VIINPCREERVVLDWNEADMSRIVLVTGGTRGIGLAVVARLVQDGYAVFATYREDAESARACQNVHGIPVLKCDVSHPEDCVRVVNEIEAGWGPIDVLVNNAGITRDAMFHRMTKEAWDQVVSVNLDGVFNLTRLVIPGMRARRFGRIVNISSVNGQKGQIGQTNYTATKAAVLGFTRALALETAALGITVNAIAPGYIATEMTAAMPPDQLAMITATIPVGRHGLPEEIGSGVAFLARDDSGFITGSCLSINGGQYLSV
jgi:acetoacetyl-CoA reductase